MGTMANWSYKGKSRRAAKIVKQQKLEANESTNRGKRFTRLGNEKLRYKFYRLRSRWMLCIQPMGLLLITLSPELDIQSLNSVRHSRSFAMTVTSARATR